MLSAIVPNSGSCLGIETRELTATILIERRRCKASYAEGSLSAAREQILDLGRKAGEADHRNTCGASPRPTRLRRRLVREAPTPPWELPYPAAPVPLTI